MATMDMFPGVFSSDFIISDITLANLENNVPRLLETKILPRRLIAPVFVLWDLTYRCNLSCSYCYNNSSPKSEHAELSRVELFRLADELIAMKVFSVCLSGGEPIMRDEFLELARYLGGNGVIVSTITNGYDISPETAREMAEVMGLVQVSLEGASAEVHDRLRGRGCFDRTVETIATLKKAGVRQVRVSSLATRENIDKFPDLLRLCLELGVDDLRAMPPVPIGRALGRGQLLPEPEELRIIQRRFVEWSRDPDLQGRITVEFGDPVHHIRLGMLFGFLLGINITAHGHYRFCPYINVGMGNFREMSLQQAWDRGLANAWLHPVISREMDSVKSVNDFRHLFGGTQVIGHSDCLDLFHSGGTNHA